MNDLDERLTQMGTEAWSSPPVPGAVARTLARGQAIRRRRQMVTGSAVSIILLGVLAMPIAGLLRPPPPSVVLSDGPTEAVAIADCGSLGWPGGNVAPVDGPPPPADVPPPHTSAELAEARQAIGDNYFGDLMTDTAIITAISTDESINRVVIMVTGDPNALVPSLEELTDLSRLCVVAQDFPDADDAVPALTWRIDPTWTPTPEATQVPLLVAERSCASGGTAEDRIVVRDVSYEDDAIVVDVAVIPLPGMATCQGSPPTPFVLNLDEPLNGRRLIAP